MHLFFLFLVFFSFFDVISKHPIGKDYDYADNIYSNSVMNVVFKTKLFATAHIKMCILNENPGSDKLKSYRIALRQSVANV